MTRIPTLTEDKSRHTRRTRLGRAGLDTLMRDARYWDGNHPDHTALVDMMRKGFELVFSNRPAGSAGPRRPSFGTPPSTGKQTPRDPFAESFARLVPDENGLEDLPSREREALGRNIVLHALRTAGHRLPEGIEDEIMPRPVARSSRMHAGDTQIAQGGAPLNNPQSRGQKPSQEHPEQGKVFPRLPIGKDGKEIRPHPKDFRFNPDGSLRDDFLPNDPWRIWYAENSRFNPESGSFEWYEDLHGFRRDPQSPGRWIQDPRPPTDPEGNDDRQGLPPVIEDTPPDVLRPHPPGPPNLPVTPPPERPRIPRPRR